MKSHGGSGETTCVNFSGVGIILKEFLPILLVLVFSVFSQESIGISEDVIAEQTDSIHQDSTLKPAAEQTASECFPPCRSGYICNQGQCIELCNPPCPPGTRCSGNGECVATESVKPKSNKSILKVNVTPSDAEICIDGHCIHVDSSTSFSLPNEDDHVVLVKKQGYFPVREKESVDRGEMDQLSVTLTQMKFHGSFWAGFTTPIPIEDGPYIGFAFEAGAALPKHRMGGIFNISIMPADSTDRPDGHIDRMVGGGFVYRFTGIGNNFKFIPGIALGIWNYRHYYYLINRSSMSINGNVIYSNYNKQVKFDSYSNYVYPNFALVWGAMNKVSFKYQMGVWVGQKTFIDMVNFGIVLSL